MFENVEEQVRSGVEWLRLLIESLGAAIIAVGVIVAVIGLLRHVVHARG